MPNAQTPAPEITTEQAAEMAQKGAVVLDVREPDEWASGHIENAMHQPLAALEPASLPAGTPIVAVCRSGNRSAKAAATLAAYGHEVYNMTGGMKSWSDQGRPMVDDHGRPGAL